MFKMAPNSLFAVLLRSSWWISFSIGLAFVVLSKIFLPADYWAFGAFGSIVFFVIAGIRFSRQWRIPGRKKVESLESRVREMSWSAFSEKLEKAFARDGYQIKKLNGPADFAITRAGRTGLIAAKRWKAAQHSEDSLRLLHAEKEQHGAVDCTLICLEPLGEKARSFAEKNKVQVMQGVGLAQLLRD
jgi:restriction system protein